MVRYLTVASAIVLVAATLAGGGLAALSAVHRTGVDSTRETCPAWPGGSGLLADGDFSGAPYPGSSWVTLRKGERIGPHWKVVRNTIDFVGGYFATPDGVCSIDLDGDFRLGSSGGIAHASFPTLSGTSYTVTFLFSGNGFTGAGDKGPIKTMRVSAAGQTATFTWNVSSGNDAQNGDFAAESWTFMASSDATRLTFRSLDPKRSCCGPVIAAVAVAQASR